MHGEIQADNRAHEQHCRRTEMKTHWSKTSIVLCVFQEKDTNTVTHLSSSYKHRHSGFKDMLKITRNLTEDHLTLLTSSIHQIFTVAIYCYYSIQLTVWTRRTDSAGRCIVKILRIQQMIKISIQNKLWRSKWREELVSCLKCVMMSHIFIVVIYLQLTWL